MAEVASQDYKLVSRVSSYFVVSKVIETSMECYNWGKKTSKVVAFAETSLEGGIQWLKPKVEPLLDSPTYKTYAEPLLMKADSLGCAALDSVENRAFKLKSNYQSTKNALENGVHTAKNVTYDAFEKAQEKIVVPMDDYLKESVVATPINMALNVTESMVNRILPEDSIVNDKQEEEDEEDIKAIGPIRRTSRLSKKAFAKLHHLSLRAPERLMSMKFTVDLIKYSAESFDQHFSSVARSAMKKAATTTEFIKKAPKKIKEKVSHDATTVMNVVVGVVSNGIPLSVSTRVQQLKEASIARARSLFAQPPAKVLRHWSSVIAEYVNQRQTLPGRLLSNLFSLFDKLVSFVEHPKKERDRGQPIFGIGSST